MLEHNQASHRAIKRATKLRPEAPNPIALHVCFARRAHRDVGLQEVVLREVGDALLREDEVGLERDDRVGLPGARWVAESVRERPLPDSFPFGPLGGEAGARTQTTLRARLPPASSAPAGVIPMECGHTV